MPSAKRRLMHLESPTGGIHKGVAVQKQPPWTTPDCQNYRPRDFFEGRKRGGSRRGLKKAFSQELGSGNPVRLLAQLDYMTGTPEALVSRMVASANGKLYLEDSSGDMQEVSLPTQAGGPDAISSDKNLQAVQLGQTLYIADYSDKRAEGTDGVYQVAYSAFSGTVTGNKLNGTTQVDSTASVFASTDVGRTLWIPGIGAFVIATYVSATRVTVTGDATCVGVSDYFVFKEAYQFPGTVTGVKDNGTSTITASTGVFDSTDVGKILRIEDAGDFTIASYVSETEVTVTGDASGASASNFFIRTKIIFTSASVADWVAAGASAGNDIIALSGTKTGQYPVLGVHADCLFIDYASIVTNTKSSGVTFYVVKAPLKFDGTNLRVYYDSTNNNMPLECASIGVYRDRIVFAKENAWYMSRQGDPTDWDYSVGADDAQRAVASTSSDAGQLGDIHKALIPGHDDYLFFGCLGSLWLMRGDPAYSGVNLGSVSDIVGTVDKQTWCKGPEGQMIFLSQKGLYEIPPNASGFPQPLSEAPLPDDLKDLDVTTHHISLAFNHRENGIHILISPISTTDYGEVEHYWFDWEDKTFYPDKFESDHEPFVVANLKAGDSSRDAVLFGCRDGYVRRFNPEKTQAAAKDDGTEIESYVVIGPIYTAGDPLMTGEVSELIAIMGELSGDVTWEVIVADSPEEVLVERARKSGTWVAQRNKTVKPRVKGNAFAIKISNSTGDNYHAWYLESLLAIVTKRGKLRMKASLGK